MKKRMFCRHTHSHEVLISRAFGSFTRYEEKIGKIKYGGVLGPEDTQVKSVVLNDYIVNGEPFMFTYLYSESTGETAYYISSDDNSNVEALKEVFKIMYPDTPQIRLVNGKTVNDDI